MFLRSDRKNKPVPRYMHTIFYIYWCSCFYECSLFFHVNFGYCVLPHNFNLKNSFSVSCRAVISVKISLNFFYLGMSIFSHFLKDSFAGYRILGWQSSNFYTLKCYLIIFWHSCLFLYIIRYILTAFLNFCLLLNFVSLTMMHLGIKLFRFILLGVHEI